jgi:hypothetical protein
LKRAFENEEGVLDRALLAYRRRNSQCTRRAMVPFLPYLWILYYLGMTYKYMVGGGFDLPGAFLLTIDVCLDATRMNEEQDIDIAPGICWRSGSGSAIWDPAVSTHLFCLVH